MTDARLVPVILVDDDPDEHFLFKADLEDSGIDFEFKGFTRPEGAMAHLTERAGGPVLVLCDLSLAGGDALQFIADTQTVLGGGAIGVYSGARNPEMEQKCREAGAVFYMVKPVTRAKLVEALAKTGGMALTETATGRAQLTAV